MHIKLRQQNENIQWNIDNWNENKSVLFDRGKEIALSEAHNRFSGQALSKEMVEIYNEHFTIKKESWHCRPCVLKVVNFFRTFTPPQVGE